MYFSYFDESGDDGYPSQSSELFVLTSIYFNYQYWKSNYELINEFRRELKQKFGLPAKQEFHTKEFIQDKNPYHGKFMAQQRKEILFNFFELIPKLKLKIICVVIDKSRIRNSEYDVLKNALTYNIQRIENDLNKLLNIIRNPRFLIITDEGRLAKMRKTAREIQRFNNIPSKVHNGSYRSEIKNLIEDVLSKKSSESYFIQLADMLSFVVSLYAKQHKCTPKIDWGKRVRNVLDYGDEIELLETIKTKLNTKASSSDPYGIVYYPK